MLLRGAFAEFASSGLASLQLAGHRNGSVQA